MGEIRPKFTAEQIAIDPILRYFAYEHLPAALQDVSKKFACLVQHLIAVLPHSAERTVALRKLLEAKDAAVRANLPEPVRAFQKDDTEIDPTTGEPIETGGHDISVDGPPSFR